MKKKVYERVKKLLEENPPLRDNLNLTLKEIWEEDLKNIQQNIYVISGSRMMEFMVAGKLTKFETVRRMWQLVQATEGNEHLRGKNYNYRHGIAEPETVQEIKSIKEEVHNENVAVGQSDSAQKSTATQTSLSLEE